MHRSAVRNQFTLGRGSRWLAAGKRKFKFLSLSLYYIHVKFQLLSVAIPVLNQREIGDSGLINKRQ